MSVTFYFDEHVHGLVRRGLYSRGVGVVTVQEDQIGGAADPDVFDRAIELGRVLVSNDRDMLALASEYLQKGTRFNGLLFLKRAAIRDHIESLAYIAAAAEPPELQNQIWFLPL